MHAPIGERNDVSLSPFPFFSREGKGIAIADRLLSRRTSRYEMTLDTDSSLVSVERGWPDVRRLRHSAAARVSLSLPTHAHTHKNDESKGAMQQN